MALTTGEHRAVKRSTQRVRNAAARARRAAPPTIIRVQDGPRTLLIAVSRSAPGVGYLLRRGDDGRLVCSCHGYTWRGRCAHTEAATAAGWARTRNEQEAHKTRTLED